MLTISLFRTNEFVKIDLGNISISLYKIAGFIKNKALEGKSEQDIPAITEFDQAAWNLISSIYEVELNTLKTDNNSRLF